MALAIFLLAVWLGGNALILPLALLGHWIADRLDRRAEHRGHRA